MTFTNLQIDTESIPSIDDVVLKPISKAYLKIIALNKLMICTVLISAVFLGKYFIEKNEESLPINFWYVLAAVIVFCIVNLIVSFLAFKKRKYAIRAHDVIYVKGLIVHSIVTVPMSRIQHVEESRSWLARSFGLATLNIYTAGESGSDLSIRGLPYLEATQIKDIISAKVNGND